MNFGTPQEMYDDDLENNPQGNNGCLIILILIVFIIVYFIW
jgi:hypothetical protein